MTIHEGFLLRSFAVSPPSAPEVNARAITSYLSGQASYITTERLDPST